MWNILIYVLPVLCEAFGNVEFFHLASWTQSDVIFQLGVGKNPTIEVPSLGRSVTQLGRAPATQKLVPRDRNCLCQLLD